MVTMICGKCNTSQDLVKRIFFEGKPKEFFTYWCPNCKDQISPGACRND